MEERLNEYSNIRWLRLHALFAPFGVCAVTALLLARSGQWAGWESLPAASSLVDLGAAVYGMVAVLTERSIDMVFWALEQRRKRAKEREKELQDKLAQGIVLLKLLGSSSPSPPAAARIAPSAAG